MRTVLVLSIATLLSLSINSMAATVDYEHPNLTIVAKDEPLDAVLKSLGNEMRIYITVPTGLNLVVSCDIQHQPIKQAFKTLLGDMSYSLEWEEKTGQLAGLTILAGGEGVAAVSNKSSQTQSVSPAAAVPVASTSGQVAAKPLQQSDYTPPMTEDDTAMADHQARMETDRAEHEAKMETERAEHEALMVEERAAQEERMKEEVARHDAQREAELQSYLGAKDLQPPR